MKNKIRIPKKRIYKREHTGRACKKPDCKKIFLPARSDQEFCCGQHRIDFNNDKRKVENAEINSLYKILKQNEKILEKCFKKIQQSGTQSLGREVLFYMNFNYDVFSKMEPNLLTNHAIYWSLGYGIEGSDMFAETLIIHKKSIKK